MRPLTRVPLRSQSTRALQTPQSAQVLAANAQYKPRALTTSTSGVGIRGASVSAGYMNSGTRGIHTSAPAQTGHTNKTVTRGGQDASVSQGHAASPSTNQSPQDVQTESVRAGVHARSHALPLDAASAHTEAQIKPEGMGSGNREQVGFVEQVGGASASRYMPDDEGSVGRVGEGTGLREGQWEGLSAVGSTGPGVGAALGDTVKTQTASPAPSQWEGHARRAFSTSASAPDSPKAGRTQKQKEAHLALDSGGPEGYEKAKLAGSGAAETPARKGSVTVGEEGQRRVPGTNENRRWPSGEFGNVGVVHGKEG
ncbi:hypothetical protein OE88DRAFT_849551 [Heliocybe sulcata]|uniref:Uncharacterized protein n=1 Tax=Heliocybe sulcata TaxID=5364 RepID=A0A5C3MQI8_9AGAM|nr:hypothetical protein OE88DRAFT_849551 [Heliocybe sulcata]